MRLESLVCLLTTPGFSPVDVEFVWAGNREVQAQYEGARLPIDPLVNLSSGIPAPIRTRMGMGC